MGFIRNVQFREDGNILWLGFDKTQDFGPSAFRTAPDGTTKGGKTDIIASTGGSIPVPGVPGAVVSLNAYRYRSPR